jgi:hypothetical protein
VVLQGGKKERPTLTTALPLSRPLRSVIFDRDTGGIEANAFSDWRLEMAFHSQSQRGDAKVEPILALTQVV